MALTQLDILYDFEPKKLNYIDRKVVIYEKKVILVSTPKSGASYLIFSHLRNYSKESYLYIDFSDYRIEKDILANSLQSYIRKKGIILLVIEHFDFSFELPDCEEIIITTNIDKDIDGFSKKRLYPLDFEEYIAFEKRYNNIEHIFNSYANTGTFPSIALSSDIDKIRNLQTLISAMVINSKELDVLKEFSLYQSQKVSYYQIYKNLKQKLKISKDSLYKIVNDLERRGLLVFVEKFGSKNSAKKLFFIDFVIKNALTYKKEFLKRFENIIFLELYKRDKKIYYSDDIDLFLPDEKKAILCIPFLPINLLKNKVLKRRKYFEKLGITEVKIITLGNEDRFVYNSINFEVLPFWRWVAEL